jgi:hypothetical protein
MPIGKVRTIPHLSFENSMIAREEEPVRRRLIPLLSFIWLRIYAQE